MRQISLRCEQYETSTPYYAFRPFLRSLLDVELNGGAEHNRAALAERLVSVDEELVPWAPLLAAPLDVDVETTPEVDDLDPSFRRARLHGVVSSLLAGLLDSPTLLVLEDVHWMDDASSELLRHLGTQLPTRPWLTCTTRRAVGGGFAAAEGTPPLPALTLRLEPLPADDAKTLVRAAAGDRRLTDDDWPRSWSAAPATRCSSRSSPRRIRRGRRPSRCRTASRRSSRHASTGSRRATAPCCAGRPFSARRSRERSSPTCSKETRRRPPTRRRGTDSASSSSAIPRSLVPSASATRSSATAHTKDFRTDVGASCTPGSRRFSRCARPTPSSCCRSTSTAPTTSLRRGGTPSRPGEAHRRSGPTSRRPSSTSARSRSPTRSPSSSRARSPTSGRRSGTCRQLAGKLESAAEAFEKAREHATGALARGDRAPLQGSDAPSRAGPLRRGDRLVRAVASRGSRSSAGGRGARPARA